MHFTISMGDIGEKPEEWEVEPITTPQQVPVEEPAKSEPVPA